ncbi:MAG: NAD(P)H-quinone oxidoreductase [Bacteroidetes bacterium]|nr:NAD(P)H-quinone oxidoreductase [Bacteroidota bacterium]MDA1121357.1 NAD(P)H-quinone oxidoreductase [Bacteroidota bacterium]
MMKAIQTDINGTIEGFHIAEVKEPVVGNHQLKITVKAAGVNRADLLQRVGKYPPPPGTSLIMGLEVAGEVKEVGDGVDKFKMGDRVMALLAGGGYAEYAVVDQGSVMPIPNNMDYVDAGGIPEVFLTAFQAMFLHGKLEKGETVLIHAGASGVGTAAIQLAREAGATVIITAGTDEKISFCKELGADFGINYRTDNNFDELVKEFSNNQGTDLIIDFIGAGYMSRNIKALGIDGRIVMLAFLSGGVADGVDLAQILSKRITFMGSTLRSRSIEYKSNLTQRFQKSFLHLFEQHKLKPVIDSVYPWDKIGEAHQRMEQNLNIGKIILQLD